MSHERLAAELGCGVSTIYRSIQRLKKLQLIKEIPPTRRGRRTKHYRLLVGCKAVGIDPCDKSIWELGGGQNERQNQNESKLNPAAAPGRRRCVRGKEALRIGELIIKLER
jgi:hypothetical protein